MVEKNTELLWEQLLSFIKDERVIPIIGPELLKVDIGGETALLYTYLANHLAEKLKIVFESTDTLNTVAGRYISQKKDVREDIYPALMNAMPMLAKDKLPDALVKLAEIRSFKLFVTTSFDPLLVDALNQVRYGGKNETRVLAFSPESKDDLPEEFGQLDRATVFHLFGRLSTIPDYAVTDEDILEFMHALQSKTSRPERLFDALIKQNLMVIGCPLSDWLGRFFVRIGKKERLIVSGGKTDFMAGDQLRNEKNLTEFLHHFSSRTNIFPISSIEFVNELHQRWLALNPQTTQPVKAINPSDNEPDKMQKGAVFLSFASEDRAAVKLIRDALDQAGINVWFDEDKLSSGDKYNSKIKANIDHCSFFIPIISQSALRGGYRDVHAEWNYAHVRATGYLEHEHFILPVIIDNTSPKSDKIPMDFRKELTIDTIQVQVDKGCENFVKKIHELYRNYQRSFAQSP
jgi:hypothetical protein